MGYRTRLKYTPEMKSYIWDKYEEGNSICSIGRSFDRPSSSIHRQIALTGGIRPPERKRCPQALSLAERKEISCGIVAGKSIRAIAVGLDRPPSTVSREISRNEGCQDYRATLADKKTSVFRARDYLLSIPISRNAKSLCHTR